MPYILGLSFNYHDSSVALITAEGEVLACVDEERFSRRKHDNSFPVHAINYLLERYSITPDNIEKIAYYESTYHKKKRIARQLATTSFSGFTQHFYNILERWSSAISAPEKQIADFFKVDRERIFTSYHHLSHCCSSIYTSGFTQGDFVTLDGVGELTTGLQGSFTSREDGSLKISVHKRMSFPDSLGLFYTAITQYLGFEVNEGEYKVMGLAPYGVPLYKDVVHTLFDNIDGLNTRLNQKYFSFSSISNSSISKAFVDLLGNPIRIPETEINLRDKGTLSSSAQKNPAYFYADFAASCQSVIEDIILDICKKDTSCDTDNLVCAGGVFYNSVANGRVINESNYRNVFIYPAAGDSGNSLGAAFAYLYSKGYPVTPTPLSTAYLGREFSKDQTIEFLQSNSIPYLDFGFTNSTAYLADLLAQGKVISVFNGRAEHGPRSLGNRSILASPINFSMKNTVNEKIKFRELFRPFAPTTIPEHASKYFDLKISSRLYDFMLATCQVKSSAQPFLQATTHIDGSARVQIVAKSQNLFFYNLISSFGDLTSTYALLNTSFNVRGEPIVDSLADAVSTFFRTDIDALYLNGLIVHK